MFPGLDYSVNVISLSGCGAGKKVKPNVKINFPPGILFIYLNGPKVVKSIARRSHFDAKYAGLATRPNHSVGSFEVMLKEIRRVLFFRALFDVDRKGVLVPDALMRSLGLKQAEHETRESLVRRATDVLEQRLTQRHRLSFEKFYVRTSPWGLALLAPLCFLLGLMTNYLGMSTEVNILLNPVMALLAWNLAIYLFLAVSKLVHWKRPAAPQLSIPGWLLKLKGHLPVMGADLEKSRVLVKARARFLGLWYGQFGGVARFRAAALFHGLAACLALGVITGLYVRGLGQKYHFQWFSTFITDLETSRQLLEIFFKPALLAGYPLFRGALPALSGEHNGPAWIHLLALSSLIYIIAPRLLLVWRSLTRARRALAALGLGTGGDYDAELLRFAAGGARGLFWFDYSYSPTEPVKAKLAQAAAQVWGSGLAETSAISLEWGQTSFEPPESKSGDPLWLFCFNGAQTPEAEVHGEWMRHVLDRAHQEKAEVLAIVDHQRVSEDQKSSRQDAWRSILDGAPFAWVDGLADDPQSLRKTLSNAVWSTRP